MIQAQEHGAEEQAIAQQVARLGNDQLFQLMKSANTLYDNTRYSTLSLNEEQKSTLDSISKDVQGIKDLLNREYTVRVLRGYQSELKKLRAALRPAQPAETGRLIPLPIRAGAGGMEDAHTEQPDPLQAIIADFVEQIAVALTQAERDQRGARQETQNTEEPQ